MLWFWVGLVLMCSVPAGLVLVLVGLYFYLCRLYLAPLTRIFQEKPLFIIPRGQPVPEAEDVCLKTVDGLNLCGCYLKGAAPRRGVILFGLEFGSNRWACVPYCDYLLAQGFDIFALEFRNQGDSDRQPGYDPLQWVTDFEVQDTAVALTYLKARPDADPRGIGFFGISKGAGAGLIATAGEPYVRCFVTDGAFGTYATLVPYMRQWFRIYNSRYILQGLLPSWYYGLVGRVGMRATERERGCRFVHLERAMPLLAPRPLLMIHGAGDTYIKPEMSKAVFDCACEPKEYWLVEGAKHNQSLQVAGDEYRRRVLEFFLKYLGDPVRGREGSGVSEDSRTGAPVTSLAPPLRPSSNIPSR